MLNFHKSEFLYKELQIKVKYLDQNKSLSSGFPIMCYRTLNCNSTNLIIDIKNNKCLRTTTVQLRKFKKTRIHKVCILFSIAEPK